MMRSLRVQMNRSTSKVASRTALPFRYASNASSYAPVRSWALPRRVYSPVRTSASAFGATAAEFLAWKAHLETQAIELRVTDHVQAFSLYFRDPDGNVHEITTYEPEYVRQRLR